MYVGVYFQVFGEKLTARLLDDSFTLAKTGRLRYDVPMSLTHALLVKNRLVMGMGFLTWNTVVNHLSNIVSMLEGNGAKEKVKVSIDISVYP